jgi:hypothetical protein
MIKRWPCPCHADTPNKIADLPSDARRRRLNGKPRATTASRIFLQLGSSLGAAVVLIVLSRQITDRTTPAGQLSTADLAAAFGHTFWWILAFAAVAALPAPSLAHGGLRGKR